MRINYRVQYCTEWVDTHMLPIRKPWSRDDEARRLGTYGSTCHRNGKHKPPGTCFNSPRGMSSLVSPCRTATCLHFPARGQPTANPAQSEEMLRCSWKGSGSVHLEVNNLLPVYQLLLTAAVGFAFSRVTRLLKEKELQENLENWA
ncbi:hypothetical protein R1flu_000749 [Riccia fluitans]|uniref:Uncharacterized protein n=1 Tax=Riccia fluitans TaxID=41844 RepID=A0ABD1Y297_9MARC